MESVMSRFLRYVAIDSQSKPDSETVPSTMQQFEFARIIEGELKSLGMSNVKVTGNAIVYAKLSGNLSDNSQVPTIGFIAHLDTSPDVPASEVKPVIHENYQGGDITLPGDSSEVISVEKNPDLKKMIGDDIVTSDGTTLLGSDDKSGIASIMTMLDYFISNPDEKHGDIMIAFTPDEEVGGGIDSFDVETFGAKYAYTVDGEEIGAINCETWNARNLTVVFHGRNAHPGYAKGKMINSIWAASSFISKIPGNIISETTEGRTGFVHINSGNLSVEESKLDILVRDFEMSGLEDKTSMIKDIAGDTQYEHPDVMISVDVKDRYRNMREIIERNPVVLNMALEAARAAGVEPYIVPVRGGTDGSNLSFRGIPCPNIYTGTYNYHSRQEFNSRKSLEKTTETLVNIAKHFASKGKL